MIAAVVVGVIGVSSAGIAVARTSSDGGEARLTAASPLDPAPLDATTPTTGAPTPSASPSPSAGRPAAAPPVKPSTTVRPAKNSARPTETATKRQAQATTPRKTKAPAPDGTTKPPASGGGSGNGSGSGSDGGDSATVAEVIRLVNQERGEAGCDPLTGESRLHRAAQKHSDRQADQETMSHELPGEASMGDRVTAEGYRWGGVAENVAAGQRTPAQVMDAWMNSAGHKANILNCGYEDIGVGVTKSDEGTLYWTQNFASPL